LFVTEEATTLEINAEFEVKKDNMMLKTGKGNLNYYLFINHLNLVMMMMIIMIITKKR
jgi:hypothetical protein